MRQCRLLFQTVVLGGCKVPFSLLLGQQSGYKSAGLVPIHTRDRFTSCHYGVQVFLGALTAAWDSPYSASERFNSWKGLRSAILRSISVRASCNSFKSDGRAHGGTADIFPQLVAENGQRFGALSVQVTEYVGQVDGLLEFPEVQFLQVVVPFLFQ